MEYGLHGEAQSTVESDETHHLGLGEVLWLASYLPEARITVAPHATNQVGHLGQTTGDISVDRPPSLGVEPGSLEDLAIDVQLELLTRTVSHPDRRGVAIASKPERPFARLGTPVEPVQHAKTRVGELRRLHEPPKEGVRLGNTAETQQSGEYERRVPHPAKPVVPVSFAAYDLR
jgi:hypothetical protein